MVRVALLSLWTVLGQMPGGTTPAGMAGIPLPDPSLDRGTVAVRVVAGGFEKPVAGAVVRVVDARGGVVAGPAETDARGRTKVQVPAAGRSLRVVVVRGDVRLESVPFDVPATGGLRFLFDVQSAALASGSQGAEGDERGGGGPRAARGSPRGGERNSGQQPRAGGLPPGHPEVGTGSSGPSGREETVLWVQLRIQALEAGRLSASLTYALDVAPPGLEPGVSWPLISGYRPVEGHLPDWVVRQGDRLVVTRRLPPGRYTVTIPGWLKFRTRSLVVVQSSPWRLGGVAVVSRRYPGFRVSGPGVEMQDMGGPLQAYVAEAPGSRQIALVLSGLPIRRRLWAYLVLAAAVALGAVPWLLRRRRGERLEAASPEAG